ncbi:MAG: sigma-70 family RNA polymerase sigma factor [Candidatus Eiseniibacteriota bacterium]|nr:MAG: sigma-70 family RNA polymerase sigma factor [Candidatus Eisenbacteria bacterium]
MNDQELIHRIAEKDHAAFKSLVERYQLTVLKTCYRILGSRQDAEDVAQEVFLRVFQGAKRFRGESAVSTWLYRIAVNLSLNHRRKHKWNRYLDVLALSDARKEDPTSRLEAPDRDRPDRLLEQKERRRILAEALETLPERQRVALILHKYESLSYEEVAEVLETSLSSVESLIHRAKRNLQKRLVELIGDL